MRLSRSFIRRKVLAHRQRVFSLTASTSEAYALLFKLFCNTGDEVLVPVPSYPLFEYLASVEGVHAMPYRLDYDGSWSIDFTHLQSQLSQKTRAIVVVNPNNPTGSFLKKKEWEQLADLAFVHRLPIISDEVFMSYPVGNEDGRVKSLVSDDRVLSFSLNGLSKAAGMPQMKLAWIIVNGPPEERAIAQERLELLLDTYLSVNAPVQMAAASLLAVGADIRRELQAGIRQNLHHAEEVLQESAITLLHMEGGWSAILRLPATRTEEQWMEELLMDQNVLLQPGIFL